MQKSSWDGEHEKVTFLHGDWEAGSKYENNVRPKTFLKERPLALKTISIEILL